MQPSRRSARLNPSPNDESHPPPSSEDAPPAAPPVTRKYSRKRPRRSRPRTPPPEVSQAEAESLSDENSSDHNSETSDDETEVINHEETEEAPEVEYSEIEIIPQEERYEASRATFHARAQENPAILCLSKRPVSARFLTTAAAERYQHLEHRKFLLQKILSLTDEELADVRSVVAESGLIYTVHDGGAFQPTVVREFIANLPDADSRDDGVAVYVRGSAVVFSPSLINAMFCIPGFEEDPNWQEENIDKVCSFLSNGRIKRWEHMCSKYLTATNQVLYKLVCSNWIPTTSYTAMNAERLRFIYMLYHNNGFDFGKLVYDQIMKMGANTENDRKRRIIFPNLIQQVLIYQRVVPPDSQDVDETGSPKAVVKDKKAGLGSGVSSREPKLEEDIEHAIAELKAIRLRLRSKIALEVIEDLSTMY
ncbi:hypothetical protein Bca101_057830 [Brassica carinata]